MSASSLPPSSHMTFIAVRVAVCERGVDGAIGITAFATCGLDVAGGSSVQTSLSDERREKPIHVRLITGGIEIALGIPDRP